MQASPVPNFRKDITYGLLGAVTVCALLVPFVFIVIAKEKKYGIATAQTRYVSYQTAGS
jgi:hypothetical protein